MSYVAPGPTEPAGSGPVAAELPPAVAQAAAGRGFGPLLISGKGMTPAKNLAWGIGFAVAIVAGSFLALWLAYLTEIQELAALWCTGMVVGVIWLIRGVMAGLRGSTATYLFANGLVHVHRSKIYAVAWSEVDELWLWKAGGKMAGTLLCYYVVTFEGQKIAIDLMTDSGDRSLGERLQEIVRQLGRPVKDSGPYVRRLRP